PFGELRDLAKRSLDIWRMVLSASEMWYQQPGSLHLAYRDDEAQVLREFVQECREHNEPVELIKPTQVRRLAPAVKRAGLQLALWSRDEMCVDPREVVAGLPSWLSQRHGVVFQFGTCVRAVEMPTIQSSNGRWSTDRLWICCGEELDTLFARELQACGLMRCKLQMMRTQPCDTEWQLGPMLAAGLTLRHYASFRHCPTLAVLKRRIAEESPWFDRYGIHVLVSQNGHGELTIGDSHEYGDLIEPFDKTEIDDWIMEYLRTFLDVR